MSTNGGDEPWSMTLKNIGGQTGKHGKPDPRRKKQETRGKKRKKEEEQKIASFSAHSSDALQF